MYLRVMMAMYKKLLRLVFILEIIFARIFARSGVTAKFNIEFTFRYNENQMKKEDRMHSQEVFELGSNIQIRFLYVKNEVYETNHKIIG